jgi:hypothetical protein
MNWLRTALATISAVIPKLQTTLTLIASIIAAVAGVQVSRCLPTSPPSSSPPSTPPAPTEQQPPNDPKQAIARIQIDNAGCSLTWVLPKRSDGRYDGLSAAHCFDRVGQVGEFMNRDGTSGKLVCVALDKEADVAWVTTLTSFDHLPALHLADRSPAVGEKVWHAGFGIDRPANTETGTVTGTGGRQVKFTLSVSPGDSGGGICLDANGRVISPVCCTTRPGAVGSVWGASPEECRKLRPVSTSLMKGWTPIPIPIRMEE